MSKKKQEEVICPRCGARNNIVIWESINTRLDPEAKELLFSGFLNKANCIKCGLELEINSTLIYHNEISKLFILYEPLTKKLDIKTRLVELSNEWSEVYKNIPFDTGYCYRYATTKEKLLEEITIFDDGLNDIVVEIIKCGLKIDNPNSEIYYARNEDPIGNDTLSFFYKYGDGFIPKSYTLNGLYFEMENIVKLVDKNEGRQNVKFIDSEYANEVLNKYNTAKEKENRVELRQCPICKKMVRPTFHGLCPYCDYEL